MTEYLSFLGVKIKNRSVLASGILGVTISSLRKVNNDGAGIVTSKSVGPERRKGHRGPVIFDWGYGLINAVGLSNPGIEEFVTVFEKEEIDFPLIISIFGKEVDDFPELAQSVESLNFSFLEINISCPNVLDEFGTPFSFSRELTSKITREVKERTSKPVIVKLSPSAPNIVDVAAAAESSGADALCIMNTAGPGMVIDTSTGVPVLWNRTGGISGGAILPLTVKNVFDIYREVSIPIIGIGGVSDTDSALQLIMAGATLYGIGSGIYTKGLGIFKEIEEGISEFIENNNFKNSEDIIGLSHRQKKIIYYKGSESFKKKVYGRKDISFFISPVKEIQQNDGGSIRTLFFEHGEGNEPVPGQFYMLWKPGLDQKPYSVCFFDRSGIVFSVKERGDFSRSLLELRSGEPVGLLGPLGKGFDLSRRGTYLLVGGGIGLTPLIFSAAELMKQGKRVDLIAGGETWDSINWIEPLLDRTEEGAHMKKYYCTEDGSCGRRGRITEFLPDVIEEVKPDFALICGPEIFIQLCLPVFKRNRIAGEASIERMMKCGVGICGSCSVNPTGARTCVEGPVFSFDYLEELEEFGKYRRDESGTMQEIE